MRRDNRSLSVAQHRYPALGCTALHIVATTAMACVCMYFGIWFYVASVKPTAVLRCSANMASESGMDVLCIKYNRAYFCRRSRILVYSSSTLPARVIPADSITTLYSRAD